MLNGHISSPVSGDTRWLERCTRSSLCNPATLSVQFVEQPTNWTDGPLANRPPVLIALRRVSRA